MMKNNTDDLSKWLAPVEDDIDMFNDVNVVSGINPNGQNEDFIDDGTIDETWKKLNEANLEFHQKEQERLQAEENARIEEEKRLREQERSKRLEQDSIEEALMREKIEKEREEEERRLQEEAEARRKANPLFKIKDGAVALTEKGIDKVKEHKIKVALEKERKLEEKAKLEEERLHKEAEEKAKIEKIAETEIEAKKKSEINESKSSKPKKEKTQKVEKVSKVKEPKIKEEKESKNKDKENKKKNKPDFEYLATHDQLTGVKNATAYNLITESLSTTKNLAVIFFDINNLKTTNDTKGHAAGDKLIKGIANTIEENFPDNVYRVGGDEFIVLYHSKKESIEKDIEDRIAKIRAKLVSLSRNDKEHIIYSVAIGYEYSTDGSKDFNALRSLADAKMYENKKSIKGDKDKKKETKKPAPEYDSLLSDEQRNIKKQVRQGHEQTPEFKTEKIIREIQSEYANIFAILITDKNFDNLFIMQDIENFIEMIIDNDFMIDYSYLYVIYEKGTRFYGVDEYTDEIQALFENIGSQIRGMLMRTGNISNKEIQKIKGINIFKQLFLG